MERLGHDVEVVTALPHHLTGQIFQGYRGRFYIRDDYNGIRIHRTWVYAAQGTGIKRLLGYLSFTITSLFGLAKCSKPDILFIESPPLFLSIPGWLYAVWRKSSIVFNVSDLWPDVVEEFGVVRNKLLLRVANLLERWAYSKATVVNAITNGVYERLLDAKHIPRDKILFLPNGVDAELFAPQAPDASLRAHIDPSGKSIILYAGTHGIAHGMEVILEAATQLKKEPILFLLVGGGSAKEHLVRLASQKKLENVRFLDPVPLDILPKYFSIATASVATLIDSQMSMRVRPAKMFASMAAGVPVIFSGEGEGADLVRQADAGIVTSPGNASELVQAVRLICSDSATRSRLALNGRAFVQREFTWDQIVERWLVDLNKRLSQRRSS